MRRLKLALLGSPVSKSMSPFIYGVLSGICGIDIHYDLIECSTGGFATAASELRNKGYDGINITLPHKEQAAALFSDLTNTARECEAANCVRFASQGGNKDGIITATAENTDSQGFLWALRGKICGNGMRCAAANYPWLPSPVSSEAKDILNTKTAAILGSGGAARASVWALGNIGIGNIVFYARNLQKAEKIAAKMGETFPETHFSVRKIPENGIDSGDIFINATPLGMYGGNVPVNMSEKTVLIADWPYSANGTDLILSSEKQGIATISGMELLLRQAILNLRFWAGINIAGMYEKAAKYLKISN